jgi:hypothetical protein
VLNHLLDSQKLQRVGFKLEFQQTVPWNLMSHEWNEWHKSAMSYMVTECELLEYGPLDHN